MFEGELAPLFPSQKDVISKFELWLRLEVAHGDPSFNTLVSYLGRTRTFLRWCSSFGVDECLAGSDDINRYRASLVSEGYSRRTIQSRLTAIRHFYSARSARRIVDKYLRIAGLKKPGRSCHSLRHSTATWLLEAGVPTEVIADLLGHSSISITGIYAKVVDHRKYTPGDVLHPENTDRKE